MPTKLEPTGTCWCGCGATTDSFFVQGHDKRAEGRALLAVFGSVPHFLAALGFAPPPYGKIGIASNETWAYLARQLSELPPGRADRLALEHADLHDRAGRMQRTAFDVKLIGASLADGAAVLNVPFGANRVTIEVPFIDMLAVYFTSAGWVVRVTGAIDAEQAPHYVAFGRDEPRGITARGALRLKELGPLKDAARDAWKRIGVDHAPSLFVAAPGENANSPQYDFKACGDFDAAVRMLSFEDPILKDRCDGFVAAFRQADSAWFQARLPLPREPATDPSFVYWAFTQNTWGDRKGDAIVEAARAAYVALLQHIDRLVS